MGALARLALPLMATSFVSVAYNLTDTFWVSQVGVAQVAGAGTAGMFLWLSEGIVLLSRVGGQVFAARELGAGRPDQARRQAAASLSFALSLGLFVALFLHFLRAPLISFFRLQNLETVRAAETYHGITAIGVFFAYFGRQLTALSISCGNSKSPFRINTAGLILNIILDPLLIFGLDLCVAGAAWATVFSQAVVAVLLAFSILRHEPFQHLDIFNLRENVRLWPALFRMGLPVSLQNMGFALVSMYVARLIASFGDAAIAAQKVGAQIESISWTTAEGFAQAVTSFIAQNHGNGQLDRAQRGYRTALALIFGIGLANTLLLFGGSRAIFGLFIQEPAALAEGARYLKIVALSQAFMCLEMVAGACFNGFGRTVLPSTVVLTGVVMRIPLSHLLMALGFGVVGIWWSISLSSILMGIVMVIALERFRRRLVYAHSASCGPASRPEAG